MNQKTKSNIQKQIEGVIHEHEKLEPEPDFVILPLIENKHKNNVQFKINIPKKLAAVIGLNKKDFRAKFTLDKTKEGDLNLKAEIIKINAN